MADDEESQRHRDTYEGGDGDAVRQASRGPGQAQADLDDGSEQQGNGNDNTDQEVLEASFMTAASSAPASATATAGDANTSPGKHQHQQQTARRGSHSAMTRIAESEGGEEALQGSGGNAGMAEDAALSTDAGPSTSPPPLQQQQQTQTSEPLDQSRTLRTSSSTRSLSPSSFPPAGSSGSPVLGSSSSPTPTTQQQQQQQRTRTLNTPSNSSLRSQSIAQAAHPVSSSSSVVTPRLSVAASHPPPAMERASSYGAESAYTASSSVAAGPSHHLATAASLSKRASATTSLRGMPVEPLPPLPTSTSAAAGSYRSAKQSTGSGGSTGSPHLGSYAKEQDKDAYQEVLSSSPPRDQAAAIADRPPSFSPQQQQHNVQHVVQNRHSQTPLYAQTHPPVSGGASASNRASAPIITTSSLSSPYLYNHHTPQLSHQATQRLSTTDLANNNASRSALVASPVQLMGLNDAGFGSSSPYPPMGQAQQQRYSLPLQASNSLQTFTNSGYAYPGAGAAGIGAGISGSPSATTTLLRPQPTTNYGSPGQPGSGRHLPEMHPSALEARPSNSAPFPPSSSPPRNGKQQQNGLSSIIAAPAAVQQRERPDASRPLGQEICLECLMRDRDMADVEVTGPGVWSRSSDIDFEEALRAEEVAIRQQAALAPPSHHHHPNGGGAGTASSAEDHSAEYDYNPAAGSRRPTMNGNSSTDENYFMPIAPVQNGKYLNGIPSSSHRESGGGLPRSPSRESSLSDSGARAFKKQHVGFARRRIGSHDPLSAPNLKLWTQMNHVSSSHRYRVLQDFVGEQTRLLELERRAHEDLQQEREKADRAIRDSPAKMSFDTRSSLSSTTTTAPKLMDLRRRSDKGRMSTTQLMPNGMVVESIDTHKDEKEAKARAKAASRARRVSSRSPTEARKSFAPSIKSFASMPANDRTSSGGGQQINYDGLPSPSGTFSLPWLADERRRFSSPMLSSKYKHASSDNLTRTRQFGDSQTDLRMSTHSMMPPPPQQQYSGSGGSPNFRSPSPSRQSVYTNASQRDSRGWRKSFWPRSASASVLSFPQSGSMMEMHLGMSQDKHTQYPMPNGGDYGAYNTSSGGPYNYNSDLQAHEAAAANMRAPGGMWPDNASALDENGGGISPDENVEAVKVKTKKKKRFQKLFNSLLGTHHGSNSSSSNAKTRKSAEIQQQLQQQQHQAVRPEMPPSAQYDMNDPYAQQQYQDQQYHRQQYQQQQQAPPSQQRYSQSSDMQSQFAQQQRTSSSQRRNTGFNYAAAAYQDDYSQPLAPPPSLSYLTGQKPHTRSYSSSSQSSASPVIPTSPYTSSSSVSSTMVRKEKPLPSLPR